MQRVLITGGSGFVGRHFIANLRRTRPELKLRNLDVVPCVDLPTGQQHVAPLEDEAGYRGIPPPVDAVVHLAAVFREPGFPTRRYYEVNTHGTATLSRGPSGSACRRFSSTAPSRSTGRPRNPRPRTP